MLAENDGMAGGVIAALERRASPARFRCPVRMATSPRSTGWRSGRRRWTSGRTAASSARPRVRRRWRCARTAMSPQRRVRLRSRRRAGSTSHRSSSSRFDHAGQPRRGPRGRMDHRGGTLRGRGTGSVEACPRPGVLGSSARTCPPPQHGGGHVDIGGSGTGEPTATVETPADSSATPITPPPQSRDWRGTVASSELDTRLLGMLASLAAIWIAFHVLSGGGFLTDETSGTSRSRARPSPSWRRGWSSSS